MDNSTEQTISIVGVRFKDRGKVYTFAAGELQLKKDDFVVVHAEDRLAVGTVVTDVMVLPDGKLPENLKKVERKATGDDLKAYESNKGLEAEAFNFCGERIEKRNLPMKLVDVECLLDRSKVIFFFVADNRVDFRELVKDLVQKYKTRIELRQIWVRSEARLCGGIGICGRELCCASFLNTFAPVSIKMAKEQNMLLNPEKISGLCGRLMCCLAFENDIYTKVKKRMPKCGKNIETPAGKGKVVRQNVLEEKICVYLEEGKEIEISIDEYRKYN
ncbi:MAG: stage 0 sporulation family protein [Deltaproteobacteria bacterium]|nr:stage 0 sporulation family protein [Deltaproteobacteria bacterium]